MPRYASVDPKPLSEIAIIDEETIQIIASQISIIPPDLSGYVQKEIGKSLVFNTEIAKIHALGSDNQDLSGLQPKETGKGLSSNDFTTALKTNYDLSYSHSQSIHAPGNAQKNSDILKSEIEAVLIGEIDTHTHAGGGGGLTQQQILRMI